MDYPQLLQLAHRITDDNKRLRDAELILQQLREVLIWQPEWSRWAIDTRPFAFRIELDGFLADIDK